jgi:hypothetical protein
VIRKLGQLKYLLRITRLLRSKKRRDVEILEENCDCLAKYNGLVKLFFQKWTYSMGKITIKT